MQALLCLWSCGPSVANLTPPPLSRVSQAHGGADLQCDSSCICRGSGLGGAEPGTPSLCNQRGPSTTQSHVVRGQRGRSCPRSRQPAAVETHSSVLNTSDRPARPESSHTFPAGDSHPPWSVATEKANTDLIRHPPRPYMALCTSSISENEFLCAQVSDLFWFFRSPETVHFLTSEEAAGARSLPEGAWPVPTSLPVTIPHPGAPGCPFTALPPTRGAT
uniref:Uncharacterized protein n=1 Tax=Myotis myotis TaxID=51298 RepID=A0A7J7ZXQ9_MYOMY|nr:hypothetical protein mMyoMyo1_009577 [Myotis myotis]